jgi:anti-sigma B factor antagonist
MAMDFTEIPRDDGITILKLTGRMDIEGTEKIDLRLTIATSVDGARVIADLSEVSFMSSIGIGGLVRLAKMLGRRHGNLVLLDPQPVVSLILEKTGIPKIIRICYTLEEALVAVREAPLRLTE